MEDEGGCGKTPYTKREAETLRNARLQVSRTHHLEIYHCPACNAWHLTRKSVQRYAEAVPSDRRGRRPMRRRDHRRMVPPPEIDTEE